MRKASLIILFFIQSLLFAKPSLINNINFVSYISEKYIGMQINPVLTGMKGEKLNQEMNLNLALYYQNKYTLNDNQVLGHLEGRLISETPLSSFDLLDRIKKDTSLEVSNFANSFETYEKALQVYQEVLKKMVNDSESSTEYAEEDVEYYYEYTDETNYTEGANTADTYSFNNKLKYMPSSFVAKLTTNITQSSISKEELEFLIKSEKLKKAYQQFEESKKTEYKDQFDPADPAERFTVVFVGDSGNFVWSKSFGLNGTDTYQSYNSSVWYLGYKIPLIKKDLRMLHKLFSSNKNITYFVKGSQSTIDFKLSSSFISAMQELVDVYVRGGFVLDDGSKFPMMSNSDDLFK